MPRRLLPVPPRRRSPGARSVAPRVALLALLGSGGCLLVQQPVELHYETAPSGRVAALEAGLRPARPPVLVPPVEDVREGGRGLGQTRGFLGLKVADLSTSDDVGLWIADALVAELRLAGFEARRGEPSPEREAPAPSLVPEAAPPTEARVPIRLRRLRTSPDQPWDARVDLEAELWVGDQRLLHRRYEGLAEGAPEGDLPSAFARALRHALLPLVGDVDRVLAGSRRRP